MTDSQVGNPENPVFTTERTARLGFTNGEIIGAGALLQDWSGAQTDRYYGVMAPFTVRRTRIMTDLNIDDLEAGLIIIRTYALENQLLRSEIDPSPELGPPKERLDNDPRISLTYDNGGVLGYVKW